jgi:hypothetical protein
LKGIYAIINLTTNQKEGFYENRKNSGSSGIVPVGMLGGICGTGCKNI